MAIDSPSDKIREIVSEPADTVLDALVKVAAVFNVPVKLFSLLKEILSGADTKDHVRQAVFALCDEVERIDGWLDTVVDEPWFRRAVKVLIVEAGQAADERKASELGIAMARGCFPDSENEHRREELGTYIRELVQLSVEDVRMLRILRDVNADAIKSHPNFHDPNPFTENFPKFKAEIVALKIHQDDALSSCIRLAGFGLAVEVARNVSRQAPGEHCFRPTRRGLYTLTLLEAVSVPAAATN